jgi:hypothetical protein
MKASALAVAGKQSLAGQLVWCCMAGGGCSTVWQGWSQCCVAGMVAVLYGRGVVAVQWQG